MRKHPYTIVFAGGGSGGHVYPTLAIADAIRKDLEGTSVPFRMVRMGPQDGYDVLFENHGIDLSTIAAGKVRRYASLQNFLDAPKFLVGLCQALVKLFLIMPDVVFSKGGTGALPVILAAWFYRIPIAIHESDSKPGLTNLVSARFAKKIFVSFAEAAEYFDVQKVVVTGTPVRTELFADKTSRELAKETFGFDPSVPLTLVLGGSQGAQRVNDFILANLSALLKETQILHQTGVANLADVQKLSHAALIDNSFKNRYQAVGYFTDDPENPATKMGMALNAADLVIARAGSSTIAEIAAFGLPAIFIPLAGSANGHQQLNAYAFSKTGAAVVIEEANLLPGIFMNQVKVILADKDLRAKMGAASRLFYVSDAAEKIAGEILAL